MHDIHVLLDSGPGFGTVLLDVSFLGRDSLRISSTSFRYIESTDIAVDTDTYQSGFAHIIAVTVEGGVKILLNGHCCLLRHRLFDLPFHYFYTWFHLHEAKSTMIFKSFRRSPICSAIASMTAVTSSS